MPSTPFAEWLTEVDANLDAFFGLSHDDIPDCDWWALWRVGCLPSQVTTTAVSNLFTFLAFAEGR